MNRLLHIVAILWAWGCWIWVIQSHKWIWLAAAVVPYFVHATFGHRLGRGPDA